MKTIIPFAAALALTFGASQALLAEDLQLSANTHKTFEEVDTNGDGEITKEEADAAGISIDWTEADQDGNGLLSSEEYMKVEEMGSSPSQPSQPSDGVGSGGGM